MSTVIKSQTPTQFSTSMLLSSSVATPLATTATLVGLPLINLPWVSGPNQLLGLDQLGYLSGTLASSASVTIDLYTLGGGNDGLGNAFTIAKCKLIIIQNLGATSGTPLEADTLIVGAAGSSPWIAALNSTGTITLPGTVSVNSGFGGFVILGAPGAAGYAVPSGAGANNLKLLSGASANTIGYAIYAYGATS